GGQILSPLAKLFPTLLAKGRHDVLPVLLQRRKRPFSARADAKKLLLDALNTNLPPLSKSLRRPVFAASFRLRRRRSDFSFRGPGGPCGSSSGAGRVEQLGAKAGNADESAKSVQSRLDKLVEVLAGRHPLYARGRGHQALSRQGHLRDV